MDERWARSILSGRLVFGDPLQLHAKLLLVQCQRARDKLARCPWCEARGVRRRGPRRVLRLCSCIERETHEVLRALGVDVPEIAVSPEKRSGVRLTLRRATAINAGNRGVRVVQMSPDGKAVST